MAVLAGFAMLVFASMPAGTHSLSQHAPAVIVANDAHSHDHGDHSHDDELEFALYAADAPDHHHADHTHEKAGLVAVTGDMLRNVLKADYALVDGYLDGGLPFGIDRPPRSVSRA